MKKTTRLKSLLNDPGLAFLLEAHNALSAKIAEESGFEGIWASGLCLSASMGVRDNNELSWTQVLDILEFMSDATSIPILVDGDTGYGNFNNMQRLVKKLEQNGIAGVCIEDKVFPKTNSFIQSNNQLLADIDEFCGKIKAGKDAQKDKDFCIVARIEAFIAGLGLKEALKRAEAYKKAGADAILIHSKRSDPSEVFDFAKEWASRLPLIVVPTTYYSTPVDLFRRNKINVVIWANQILRCCISAMQRAASIIKSEETVINLEDQIAPVSEVFRLQGVEDLLEAEDKYLNRSRRKANALVLAASRGKELGDLTASKPKAMICISGKPILQRLVEDLAEQGVKDITVVAGYKPQAIKIPGINIITNPKYANSRDLASLGFVLNRIGENTIITYGDVIVRRYIIRNLLEAEYPLNIVVDSNISHKLARGVKGDYVQCSEPDDLRLSSSQVRLVRILDGTKDDKINGQWIGMLKANLEGRLWIEEAFKQLKKGKAFLKYSITDLLNRIVAGGHAVNVIYTSGHWLDVNSLGDIEKAADFTKGIIS